MKTAALTMVRKHYQRTDVPRHVARHNMRAWCRSLRMLGDKWLLAKHVGGKTP